MQSRNNVDYLLGSVQKLIPANYCWLLLCLLIQCSSAAEVTSRPNILFILADDLGWADTTLYGHTRYYKTPNIERLAKRGMTFTRAYSASPLCSPTRSAILTGLSPARTGITTPNCHLPQVVLEAKTGTKAPPDKKSIQPVPPTRLKTEYRTLAESLKDAGYATGHFGKWHLGPDPYSPLQQGFDVDIPHWAGPGPAGSYVAPWKFKDFDPDPAIPNQHIEDRMAKEAIAWMEKQTNRPFFLNYWMFSVHAPFDAKRLLIEKYRGRIDTNDMQRCPTYAAMVESMDDAVGSLLDALDRLKIADRTLVIFTSDNGGNMYNEVDGTTPTSNRPLRGGKATLFEGGIRVPCVISWPSVVQAGTTSDMILKSEDYYPTLIEAIDLKPQIDQQFDGVSILKALKGQHMERKPVFTYFPHDPNVPDWLPPAIAVHHGDWKLIRIFHGGEKGAHRWKLFNLRSDLGERNDLAEQQPERVKELDNFITRFLEDTKAVLPVPNPAFDPAQYHPEDEGNPKPRASATAKATPGDGDNNPNLQGWKARNCSAFVTNGIAAVRGQGSSSFLGVAAGTSGPAQIAFRIRCAAGGNGKVEWIPPGSISNDSNTVTFAVQMGGWQNISATIPAQGPMGILRLHLPAQKQTVEIDWIELKNSSQTRRWEF